MVLLAEKALKETAGDEVDKRFSESMSTMHIFARFQIRRIFLVSNAHHVTYDFGGPMSIKGGASSPNKVCEQVHEWNT